jgi:hypothetical protein
MPAVIVSLLYVSRKALPAVAEEHEIAQIVQWSMQRNLQLEVTGLLLATAGHFAQILEGPQPAIDALMTRIRRDWRHQNVRVLRETEIENRFFPNWSLGYSGWSDYLASFIAPLAEGAAPAPGSIERLTWLMHEWVASL